jgi:hypothetical protein
MSERRSPVRDTLLEAALWFVPSAARLPGVQRIALIGSIVTDRPSPKDVDLLVYVTNDVDLAPLAELGRRLKGRLQSHSRGADVFLANGRGRYLGRTCSWKRCRPGIRASCDALHCGRRPFLHDDLATVKLADSLIGAPPLELWPVVVRRVVLPADVERFVARLGEPHNNALQRTHSRVTPLAEEPQASRHAARR